MQILTAKEFNYHIIYKTWWKNNLTSQKKSYVQQQQPQYLVVNIYKNLLKVVLFYSGFWRIFYHLHLGWNEAPDKNMANSF